MANVDEQCGWCTERAEEGCFDEDKDPACKKHKSDVHAELYCRESGCMEPVHLGSRRTRVGLRGLCKGCKHRKVSREGTARYMHARRSVEYPLTSVASQQVN